MAAALIADLRSDTLTQPSQEMRQAMAYAEVGDDVYGEDPTVNALEEHVAALVGHEAGLYCSSGSQTNMLGVAVSVEPGFEVLAESRAHILRAEVGAHAALAGVTSRNWISPDGTFCADDALALVSAQERYNIVGTALIEVENTHNFSGGRISDFGELVRLREATRELGVRVHVDGARLAHAVVAGEQSFADHGSICDTLSICLSKGLGAPVGSVLTGPRDLIERARYLRKRYGGGMRQAGIIAAAGLYAIEHNVDRLVEDHESASRIAEAVAAEAPEVIDPSVVETNIGILRVDRIGAKAADVAVAAAEAGVRVTALSPTEVRFVTHLDVSAEAAGKAAQVLAEVVARSRTAV